MDDYYGCAAEGLWKAVLKFGDSYNFKASAIECIKNQVKNERKRNFIKGKNECVIISMNIPDVQDQVENISCEGFEENLILGYAFEEKSCLSNNRDRKIVSMKYQGFNNYEIAEALHISEPLVRKRLKVIKRILSEENLATSKQMSKTMAN